MGSHDKHGLEPQPEKKEKVQYLLPLRQPPLRPRRSCTASSRLEQTPDDAFLPTHDALLRSMLAHHHAPPSLSHRPAPASYQGLHQSITASGIIWPSRDCRDQALRSTPCVFVASLFQLIEARRKSALPRYNRSSLETKSRRRLSATTHLQSLHPHQRGLSSVPPSSPSLPMPCPPCRLGCHIL